jgi:hypothetical protein
MCRVNHALLPRFAPLRRFPNHGERPNPARCRLTGYATSSGFRTLTTSCSPHDLPSLFHLGPVLGVAPLRGFSPPLVPYILSDAATLARLASRLHAGPEHLRLAVDLLLRVLHTNKVAIPKVRISHNRSHRPPWGFPPPGCRAFGSLVTAVTWGPSHAFSIRSSSWPHRWRLRVLPESRSATLSSHTDPHGVYYLVVVSSLQGVQFAGPKPSEVADVADGHRPLLCISFDLAGAPREHPFR